MTAALVVRAVALLATCSEALKTHFTSSLFPDGGQGSRRALELNTGNTSGNPWGSTAALKQHLHHRSAGTDLLWDCYLNLPWVPEEGAQALQPPQASKLIGSRVQVRPGLTPFGRFAQFLPVAIVLGLGTGKMGQLARKRVNEGVALRAFYLMELTMALCLYLVSGPAVILVNKHIMRHFHFPFPILLASLGNFFLMLVTRGAALLGFQSPDREHMGWRNYLTVVVPINVFNFTTQVAGMYTYLYISVPEIQILKSFTIVFVLVFAWLLAKERVSSMLAVSIGVITAGVGVSAMYSPGSGGAGHGTGHAMLIGFVLSMIASSAEALKTVYSQIMMRKLSLFDGIYWASPSFVVLAAVFVGAIELRGLVQFDWSWRLALTLVLNALLTGVIVLSTFWFLKLAGALTLKVISQGRSIGLILISVLFFSETCGTLQYCGYTVTLIGMGMFDHAKQMIQQEQAKQEVK